MALIKNIANNAVHWRLPGSNPTNAANAIMSQIGLSEELCKLFAKLSINGYNFEWSHPLSDWHELRMASPDQRAAVIQLVEKARQDIIQHGRGLGEYLVKVPNDEEYVFFRDNNAGNIEILFTGWGFENSRLAPPPPPVIDPMKKPHHVRIAFAIDGQPVPSRQFTLSLGSVQGKRLETDPNGIYEIGVMKVGETLSVTDIVSGKQFTLEVLPKQEDYVFDVTQTANVTVSLTHDGLPNNTDENVTVTYHGQTKSAMSCAGQPVTFTFPWWDGNDANATAMGISAAQRLNVGNNYITLNAVTPPAAVRVRMVHNDGTPYVSEKIDIEYNGRTYSAHTDATGGAVMSIPYSQGQLCRVSTGIGSDERQLRAGAEELFEFCEPAPMPQPEVFDYNIRFVDHQEIPHSNVRVVFSQDGNQWPVTLDEQGRCVLPHNTFSTGADIDIVMHRQDTKLQNIKLQLDPNEYEYVIQTVPKTTSKWLTVLMILLLVTGILSIVACGFTDWACSVLDPLFAQLTR